MIFLSADDILMGFCYRCPLEHRKDNDFCEYWDNKNLGWKECLPYKKVMNARCISLDGDYRELELPTYREEMRKLMFKEEL